MNEWVFSHKTKCHSSYLFWGVISCFVGNCQVIATSRAIFPCPLAPMGCEEPEACLLVQPSSTSTQKGFRESWLLTSSIPGDLVQHLLRLQSCLLSSLGLSCRLFSSFGQWGWSNMRIKQAPALCPQAPQQSSPSGFP